MNQTSRSPRRRSFADLFPGRVRRRRRADAGVTLPELLVAVTISGVLVAVLATAITVTLRSTPEADDRLAESKDITFLQAWVPVDLSTAINSWDDPDEASLKAKMAANVPSVVYNSALEGTNVLTLLVPNSESGAMEVIAYRYTEVNGNWRLVRYRITSPGTASERVSPVGVAHEVPDPPEGWQHGDPVLHAFQVVSRNQQAVRPVGEDVTVIFDSGNEFRTGGAGLSAEQDLTPNDPVTLPDPTAPPTRCGGRIALVIDTSGSVPANRGGIPTEQAAVGFIDAFVGTPTQISINGFDREGYAMINDPAIPNGNIAKYSANGARAEFLSVLDDNADVAMMRDRITRLDDLDGAWPGGGASIGARDPNGDRAMWDQIGSGTNWEDGLYNIFFDAAGQPHNTYQPDLVVFITDGEPNRIRNSSGTSDGASNRQATDRAAIVANQGRAQGARVIGVMVGNKANNSTYVGYLTDVVGRNRWNGSVDASGNVVDVGNAVAADYFTGSFEQLGGVLRSIMIAECGGTVTVRKQLTDGTVPPGRWNYSSPTGDQVLDTAAASSITFDFNFENGSTEQVVRISEEPRAGYTFVRGDCSVAGQPLDAGRVVQRPDGVAGVDVTVRPDQAVSCVMVSQPS